MDSRNNTADLETSLAIAELLNVSIDYLVGRVGEIEPVEIIDARLRGRALDAALFEAGVHEEQVFEHTGISEERLAAILQGRNLPTALELELIGALVEVPKIVKVAGNSQSAARNDGGRPAKLDARAAKRSAASGSVAGKAAEASASGRRKASN